MQVDSEFNAGRYDEARRASESARNINYVGIGLGTFLIVGYIVLIIVVNVSVAASSSSNDDYQLTAITANCIVTYSYAAADLPSKTEFLIIILYLLSS